MKTLLLTTCLLLASCQSKNSVNQSSKLSPPTDYSIQPKAEFVARYQRYRCTEDQLPSTEEASTWERPFKSMKFGRNLVLKLELGKLVHMNDEAGGPMRTKSHYCLFWDGKQVGEAESLFSTATEYNSPRPDFYFNAESQSLLVSEELAWSTKRCIVFERSQDANSPKKWTIKYVQPPARPRHHLSANSEDGRIRGIGNGKLYLEMDGLLYAFPFDDFLETNLEFTVG